MCQLIKRVMDCDHAVPGTIWNPPSPYQCSNAQAAGKLDMNGRLLRCTGSGASVAVIYVAGCCENSFCRRKARSTHGWQCCRCHAVVSQGKTCACRHSECWICKDPVENSCCQCSSDIRRGEPCPNCLHDACWDCPANHAET